VTAFVIITAVLGVLGVIATLCVIRFWSPTTPMTSVLWPLRLPNWIAYVWAPMTIIGFLLWTLGLGLKAPKLARVGKYIGTFGGVGFLGGWVGGVVGSYALQFFTGWPPPAATLPPKP
jgi:hypothetical protein